MAYAFDRFLRFDELTAWLDDVAASHPDLVAIEEYGRSHEGRPLRIVTVTDTATGAHDTKPAMWVDASIHAVELTATVAACHLIQRLVDGHGSDDVITRALATRTFYVVPRVNPDGAEWVLADSPRHRRSSTRDWPWSDGHEWPGLHLEDLTGDGRIRQMRVADSDGGWTPHADDARLMVPIPAEGAVDGTPTYRLLDEGRVVDHDGFTIPTPSAPQGLDLNRNYPAGWSTSVTGAGDHPLSEPEIDALVRAMIARPNVCGFNAYHTSGGVLLRPSSTKADAKLPRVDVWAWKQLGERGTQLTGYPTHSVYEDFTWDPSNTMSGASDDWAYEHLGVFGWTTEFWDVIQQATGEKQPTTFWYTGPTDEQALAVLRWCDDNYPGAYGEWQPFEHPQLGPVELGGWDLVAAWTNPPDDRLRDEVAAHADFAVFQALCAPELTIPHLVASAVGDDTWRLDVGIANTGWLATDVTEHARQANLVRPLTVEVDGADVIDGPARRRAGQLDGRAALRFSGGNDGTPDRTLVTFTIRGVAGSDVNVVADHPRAGRVEATIVLG
ncbi:MAG: M14 family metallopeptidase [Ilumatobacter sp.]